MYSEDNIYGIIHGKIERRFQHKCIFETASHHYFKLIYTGKTRIIHTYTIIFTQIHTTTYILKIFLIDYFYIHYYTNTHTMDIFKNRTNRNTGKHSVFSDQFTFSTHSS